MIVVAMMMYINCDCRDNCFDSDGFDVVSFMFQSRGAQHMLDNPGPGTVLDHTVTRKDW